MSAYIGGHRIPPGTHPLDSLVIKWESDTGPISYFVNGLPIRVWLCHHLPKRLRRRERLRRLREGHA